MVEVVPRKTEIRIRVRGCLLLLLALLILALATLWAVTGTRWGASNPYSESLNSYFGRIYRFTPKTKPQDDLPAALRLHALESVGSDRYALLFSATDRDRNALTVIPAAAVS